MVHDAQNKFNESMISTYYKDFFSKMKVYTAKHNSVYFWSNSPKVREELVPKQHKKWTKNSIVKALNNRVWNDLMDFMIKDQKSRMNVGLDLYKMSETLKPTGYKDAVHHVPEWYKMVAHQLLSMYCMWGAN